jgi:hypothetical protein
MRLRHPAGFTGLAVGAAALTACGASAARTSPAPPATVAVPVVAVVKRPALAVARPRSAIDRLTAVARRRYLEEVTGAAVHKQLRRVAGDPVLLRALRTGDLAGLRAEVRLQDATPHAHISLLRVVRGSRVLADAGIVFPVAPAHKALRDGHGRLLGTLQLSIQDVIGYVKYMRRNVHVDVVVRGRGAAHVRTSLPAAARVRLPSSGTVIVGGHRYRVRSFTEPGLAGETLRIWILKRG